MTKNISFTMSNVSGTAIAPINADNTISSGAASNALTFITPIIAQKGRPNTVLSLTRANVEHVLGKAYHPSFGPNADGRRVLDEALIAGSGFGIRVVPGDATYPALKFSKQDDAVAITNEAINYKQDLSLADGEFMALAIKDGAESDSRKVKMVAAPESIYGTGMFIITLTETDATGAVSTLEELVVSLSPTGKDSMGSPAFIETVLESKSEYLECVIDADAAIKNLTEVKETAFTGASNGSIADIKAEDFTTAIELIDTTNKEFNHIDAFGIYDTDVHKSLITLANNKRLGSFFDLDPRMTHAEALAAKEGLSLNEHRASYYHFPYTAMCPTYKTKTVWGISGVAFAAKAKGLAKSSPTPGWHYTAAGKDRAMISRTNIAPLKGAGVPDFEAMYIARLNKIGKGRGGILFIDDSLTSCVQENYLRFEQVVAVADAISRDFDNLADTIKHNPDGVTEDGLNDGMLDILDGYDSIGALVPPRDPDTDGTESFKFAITQPAIDHWKAVWSICPSGSGRRFSGEPILIK